MGYAFHITRKASWPDHDGDAIRLEEWLAVASSTNDLRPISETRVGDSVLKLPADWHSHRWEAHPQYRPNGPTFQLVNGNVNFGGHDPATMAFALQLAKRLGGRVVGDEDEHWTLEEIVGSAGDLTSNPVNPFTREPVFSEREGVVEVHGGECHLVSRRSALLGMFTKQQRALLCFIVAPPNASENLHGARIRVRGSLSEPGNYGLQTQCDNVFYVFAIIDFTPASSR